jgi:acyl-CoA reductase-like NAD-dependent aldehyde dehydrogenase
LWVGNPSDERTQVGPLTSRRRLKRVRELVQDAVSQGASLRCGGPMEVAPPGCSGAFYRPAVLTGVSEEMRIMRDPVGGPVMTVQSFDTIDRAIELANGSNYCLGASIWTAERHRGRRIARELRAGMVWLNDHLPSPTVPRGPWGAAPGGGLGKAFGRAGLEACAQEKLITWEPAALAGLWWMPYDRVAERAAVALARLRSTREIDRERAWRQGGLALARVGTRVLRRR